MAGLQINPTDIAKARESGYSDKEIADFLSAKAPDQFKAAREAGYSDSEILSHLTGRRQQALRRHSTACAKGFANVLHGPAETLKQFAAWTRRALRRFASVSHQRTTNRPKWSPKVDTGTTRAPTTTTKSRRLSQKPRPAWRGHRGRQARRTHSPARRPRRWRCLLPAAHARRCGEERRGDPHRQP
jgi:hypothetical protein